MGGPPLYGSTPSTVGHLPPPQLQAVLRVPVRGRHRQQCSCIACTSSSSSAGGCPTAPRPHGCGAHAADCVLLTAMARRSRFRTHEAIGGATVRSARRRSLCTGPVQRAPSTCADDAPERARAGPLGLAFVVQRCRLGAGKLAAGGDVAASRPPAAARVTAEASAACGRRGALPARPNCARPSIVCTVGSAYVRATAMAEEGRVGFGDAVGNADLTPEHALHVSQSHGSQRYSAVPAGTTWPHSLQKKPSSWEPRRQRRQRRQRTNPPIATYTRGNSWKRTPPSRTARTGP